MKEIPFLLAGPILRRVDSNKVHLWLATSRSTSMDAILYRISQNGKSSNTYTPLNTKTTQKTIHSGNTFISTL